MVNVYCDPAFHFLRARGPKFTLLLTSGVQGTSAIVTGSYGRVTADFVQQLHHLQITRPAKYKQY